MRAFVSFLICGVFLLQTFVTIQAMPIHEGKVKMPCTIKKQALSKHSCCSLLSKKESTPQKKGCCTGTSKMSCCVSVIALLPHVQVLSLFSIFSKKQIFGYLESCSYFDLDIFHPPILI